MATISNPFESDEVVGVVSLESSSDIEAAARDLGFEVKVLTDPSSIDVDGDKDSMFGSILRFFQEGEEKDALRSYRDRLLSGDHVVRVLGVGDRADEAAKVFATNDAEIVWHFGEWTYKPMHQT